MGQTVEEEGSVKMRSAKGKVNAENITLTSANGQHGIAWTLTFAQEADGKGQWWIELKTAMRRPSKTVI